jgi:hypothetical protein
MHNSYDRHSCRGVPELHLLIGRRDGVVRWSGAVKVFRNVRREPWPSSIKGLLYGYFWEPARGGVAPERGRRRYRLRRACEARDPNDFVLIIHVHADDLSTGGSVPAHHMAT